MSDKSKIEWTDASWNPIRGTKGNWHCTKVSEGCRNCYAERMNKRFFGLDYTVGADTMRLDEDRLGDPIRWKKPRRIFVCSMTDLFHERVCRGWIWCLAKVMAECPQHTFQILTKRPARALETWSLREYLPPLPNVWFGVSVEDQETADARIPILLEIPAAVRFVSYEPALGPVDLDGCDADPDSPYIDWVIAGGESGPAARPADPQWFRDVRDDCRRAGVPFFMKQMARREPIPDDLMVREYPNDAKRQA